MFSEAMGEEIKGKNRRRRRKDIRECHRAEGEDTVLGSSRLLCFYYIHSTIIDISYVLGTLLGSRKIAVNKTDITALEDHRFSKEETVK